MTGSDRLDKATRVGWRELWALALAVALSACSPADSQSADMNAASARAYAAMARGAIDVEGGMIEIGPAVEGRIAALEVEEGDTVAAGQVLAVLDSERSATDVKLAEAELEQAHAQVAVLRAQLPAARSTAQRTAQAAAQGAATGQAADEARVAGSVLAAQVSAAEAGVAVAEQHVTRARAEYAAHKITAPEAGRIARRNAHVGDNVSPQAAAALFELLPNRPLIVRAELNESFVDQVKPDMRAEVLSEADPAKVFAARVLRIGEVFGPSRLTENPLERAASRDVECVLQLEQGHFRIGQRVLVRFLR